MSDINDIGTALDSARRAVFSLATWVNSADARDSVRSLTITIERGIAAHSRLQRDLKDGRKHVEAPEDYERTSCGCSDPDASPPCSWCTKDADADEAAE